MTLWSLISQTDVISKFILLLLLVLSFTCWTFALFKLNILKLKTKQLKQAQPLLFHVSSLEDIIGRAATLGETFAGDLLAHYLTELKRAFKQSQNKTAINVYKINNEKKLSINDFDRFSKHIEQTAINAIENEELNIPFFSTVAQIAPLLGLFGTVWGLIHAFMSIAEQQQVDIATIAPGIAEALITTLAGLVVAIPAVSLFNLLVNRGRIFEQQLINLTLTFTDSVRSLTILNSNQSVQLDEQALVSKNSAYSKKVLADVKAKDIRDLDSSLENKDTVAQGEINEV